MNETLALCQGLAKEETSKNNAEPVVVVPIVYIIPIAVGTAEVFRIIVGPRTTPQDAPTTPMPS